MVATLLYLLHHSPSYQTFQFLSLSLKTSGICIKKVHFKSLLQSRVCINSSDEQNFRCNQPGPLVFHFGKRLATNCTPITVWVTSGGSQFCLPVAVLQLESCATPLVNTSSCRNKNKAEGRLLWLLQLKRRPFKLASSNQRAILLRSRMIKTLLVTMCLTLSQHRGKRLGFLLCLSNKAESISVALAL